MVPNGISTLIPTPLRKSIYLRPLYWPLLDLLLSAPEQSATVVTGNPGRKCCSWSLIMKVCFLYNQRQPIFIIFFLIHFGCDPQVLERASLL